MNPYSKSYSGYKNKPTDAKKRFKTIKLIGIFFFDVIFFTLIQIKKIVIWILKLIYLILVLIYKIGFRRLILPLYRLVLNYNRKQKNSLSPKANKLFFLLSNRYVSHTVIVLVIIITVIQNYNIKQLRAEDIGRESLFAKISTGQYFTDDIIEEEIIELEPEFNVDGEVLPPPPKTLEDLYPAVTKRVVLSEAFAAERPLTLAQGGSAILKPDFTETIDTPRPRENSIVYIVESNDTVFDIAEKFRISVNTILWANKLSSRSIIRPGDKLTILPVSGVTHTVKNGENVGAIAAKYKIPQEDILEINNFEVDDTLKIGQSLVIPDGRPLYTPPPRRYYATTTSTGSSGSTASSGELFWPTVCRRITQYFRGWRHTGIDIACKSASNIYAARAGVVEKAGWNSGGYGNRIIIKHSDGSKTLYAHLKAKGILVSTGESVKKGQVIGLMGSTGRSTGNHLHFEVIERGSRINPFNRL